MGAACTWAEGKLPFPLTCSQGWGSEWKAIWGCLPSEVMNTVQIRGRGLSISSALPLSHSYRSKLFSVSCSTAHSCLPHFFPQSFFPLLFSPIFRPPPPPHPLARSCGSAVAGFLGVCGLTGWAQGGREGKGSICRLRGQKAETARPSVRTQRAAGFTRPCGVTEKRDLDLWAEEKKINTDPWSLDVGLQASAPCVWALIGIWCFAENGLDRAPHELLWKLRMLQRTTER